VRLEPGGVLQDGIPETARFDSPVCREIRSNLIVCKRSQPFPLTKQPANDTDVCCLRLRFTRVRFEESDQRGVRARIGWFDKLPC
jgi:hypothetical protein